LLDGVPEAERTARCRELRALSLVYLGPHHPVTIALAAAVTDPTATDLYLQRRREGMRKIRHKNGDHVIPNQAGMVPPQDAAMEGEDSGVT
jgi:hypothetical protein